MEVTVTFTNIDAQTAKNWLEAGNAILIDVREPFENASTCIGCADLKPLSTLPRIELSQAMNKKIIVHCQSGNRSQTACEKLKKSHPDLDFYNLEGGILAWEKAGYTTIKKLNTKVLPLDRQVQLTVGLLVIMGVVLGYVINIGFLLLPLFIGMGLVFASLSGICGLAILLVKMPWNQVSTSNTKLEAK